MAQAIAAESELGYVAEVTYGVTPASPELKSLPIQSTSLWETRESIEDPTISPDRLGAAPVPGNRAVAGDMVVTLRHGQYDDLLEAVMGGTWTANVLKQGKTRRSFTMQRAHSDINTYHQFKGVRVNTFDMTVTPGSIISATFGLMGSTMTNGNTNLDATPIAPLDVPGLNSISGTVTVAGQAVCVTSATININNNMTVDYCIGNDVAHAPTWDKGIVTGSLTFFYEDLVQVNRFFNNTVTSVSLTLTDGTNNITFLMPHVNFTSADVPLPNTGKLFVTMPFTASRDAATGTSIQITRS